MAGGVNGSREAIVSPEVARLWSEWGRLTRFMESSRLAFERERNMWTTLELANSERAKLSSPTVDGRHYEVDLDDHLAAIADEEILLTSVLIHSYALAEWATAEHLSIDARTFEGIEDWGERLLHNNNRTWADVDGGKAAAVQAAVARNAFAHGARELDARAAYRLNSTGTPSRPAGYPVTLDYAQLGEHRKTLRSLMHSGGLGGSGSG